MKISTSFFITTSIFVFLASFLSPFLVSSPAQRVWFLITEPSKVGNSTLFAQEQGRKSCSSSNPLFPPLQQISHLY